jgi:hypothetical protein
MEYETAENSLYSKAKEAGEMVVTKERTTTWDAPIAPECWPESNSIPRNILRAYPKMGRAPYILCQH